MSKSAIDLSALATQMQEQIEPLAEASGITLEQQVEPSMQVHGDQGWLGRLLLILLDNAIKFTPRGGRVAIKVRRSTIESRWRLRTPASAWTRRWSRTSSSRSIEATARRGARMAKAPALASRWRGGLLMRTARD